MTSFRFLVEHEDIALSFQGDDEEVKVLLTALAHLGGLWCLSNRKGKGDPPLHGKGEGT